MDATLVRLSRFLGRVLRHKPGLIELELDKAGWADVEQLLVHARDFGVPLTRELLDEIVADNDKQRFAYSEDHSRIRANQGHTVPIDLELLQQFPPTVLFHGTGERAVPSILREGLTARGRHYVHLSTDSTTARAVGRRHGRPAVFTVDAARMHVAGILSYRSTNAVWLVERVQPQYLTLIIAPERAR